MQGGDKETLYSRALLVHTCLSIIRLAMMLVGVAGWQRAIVSNDESRNNFMSSDIEDFARISLWIITITGLLLDALSLKLLATANCFFYLELLYAAITAMFPYENGIGSSQLIIVLTLASSICLFCDPLPNLITLTVVITWLAFG